MVLSALPIMYVLLRAQEAGWAHSASLIFRPRILELLLNTLRLAGAVTLMSIFISVTTAWLIERSNLSRTKIWNAIVTLPFAVPSLSSAYRWISDRATLTALSRLLRGH